MTTPTRPPDPVAAPPPGTPHPGNGDRPTLTRRGSLLVHAGFFLTGIATVILGPVIPELAAHWRVAPATLAGLFTAQFLVSSVGSVLSGYRPWLSLLAAYPLMAAGLLGLSLGGPVSATAAAAALGMGLGLGIPSSNVLVAAAQRRRRGAALAILNLMWGVGAVACPLLFAALRGRVEATATLAGLAAVILVLGGALAVTGSAAPSLPAPRRAESVGKERAAGEPAPPATLALFAAMLFLYVGSESAVAGWLVTLADQIGGATAASMLVHSAFWGALLGGRAAAPLLLRRLPEPLLHALSLAVAAGGIGWLLAADSRLAVAAAGAVTGLGMAVVFPLTISGLTAATENAAAGRVGWVFAFGGVGGAVLPWLVPRVAGTGTLQWGFVVPLAGVLLLGVLLALHQLALRPGPAA